MRLLLGIALVLVAPLAGPAPSAQAAQADGVVSVASGVLYDDCRDHPYSYSFTLPAGTDSWSMDVEAVGPDGTTEVSDFAYGSGGIATGTGGLQFCGSEAAGSYELRATVDHVDYDNVVADGAMTATAAFSMRKPYSRTSLKVSDRSPRFNQVVVFVMKARDERPYGYFATRYATMRLEVKARGTWQRIRGSQTVSDSRGRARIAYRWDLRRSIRLRAVTKASSGYAGSTSSPVRVG
jgi:hypothetical protein